MKSIKAFLLVGAAIMLSCGEADQKQIGMKFENNLTTEEKTAGIMTPEVMWKLGRVGGGILSADGKTLLYTVTSYNISEDKGETSLWLADMDSKQTRKLGSGSSPSWSGDGRSIYYMSEDQLWKMDAEGDRKVRITDIEGGIEGYGIAPGEDRVFYIRRVKVEKRNSADIHSDLPVSKARIYDDLMVRHWNSWDEGSYLHIFIAELDGNRPGEGKNILEGQPWDAPLSPYFDTAEIAWNHTGTALAYTCKKLTGKDFALSTDSDVYLYDMVSGQTRNLTEGMPGYDKYPVFSPDDSKIAFLSMKRPGNESDKQRLMIVDLAGGDMEHITAGFDHSASDVCWEDDRTLWFLSPLDGTKQICRVKQGGGVEVITNGEHDINSLSFSSGRIAAQRTTLSSPTEIFEVNAATGELAAVTETNSEFYENIRMGNVARRMVKTTDGKEMLTWVVVPPDFDPSKRYPALLYCQGGPQSTVSQFWSYRWNAQLMAAQGYVVVMPNRRGTPSFGSEWLDQISGDYSGQNIEDYLSAIDDVAREPWVDPQRLGCVGASYGGYSVFFLAGNHNGRFKAFISHCGMFNMESFFGSTDELWFPMHDLGGPYWSDDPIAMRSYANSPHRFVRNWDTPILIFVGLNDFRIPYAESLQAFTAARMMGVPSRLVAFENEAHQVLKPQNSLLWNREFFGWLDRYVKNR